MEICRYYHDAQAPVILSIDDLSFTAILISGKLLPAYDWGYGLNGDGSLWKYLEDTLFKFYPEIKGTIFLPLALQHGGQNLNAGYDVVFRNAKEIGSFLNVVRKRFEIAFHGIEHSRYIDYNNPSMKNNLEQEFQYLKMEDIPYIKAQINQYEKEYGLKFTGGKYPGYCASGYSENIVEQLGFSWWMRTANMSNRKSAGNNYKYFGAGNAIIDIPTNLSSSCFNRFKNNYHDLKVLSMIKNVLLRVRMENYIEYLYTNGFPITIQTHFMGFRTDGKRQTPNIYDDINSLCHIYAILRGLKVWHTTCGELASYIANCNHAKLEKAGTAYTLKFDDNVADRSVTVRSSYRALLRKEDDSYIYGCYDRGNWLFDNLGAGTYEEIFD